VKGFFEIGSCDYLPGLASNHDSPDLCSRITVVSHQHPAPFFFLRGRVSLCNPVWTQIHDPPASASGVARSTVLYHHTWLQSILSTLLFTAEFLAKYPITVVLVFCCCDKIPYKSNLKEEIFILTQDSVHVDGSTVSE
jgi:hypothetical protein